MRSAGPFLTTIYKRGIPKGWYYFPIEKALVNQNNGFATISNSWFSLFLALVWGLFLASISLLIGNQNRSNLLITIPRYCADTMKNWNSPGIPIFDDWLWKTQNTGSLKRTQSYELTGSSFVESKHREILEMCLAMFWDCWIFLTTSKDLWKKQKPTKNETWNGHYNKQRWLL